MRARARPSCPQIEPRASRPRVLVAPARARTIERSSRALDMSLDASKEARRARGTGADASSARVGAEPSRRMMLVSAACACAVAVLAAADERTRAFGSGLAVGACATLVGELVVVANAARAATRAREARARARAEAANEFAVEDALDGVEVDREGGASTSREGEVVYAGWVIASAPGARGLRAALASGEKRFARLTRDGKLRMALERGGETVDEIDASGCEVALTKFPDLEKPTELRWHVSTPIVLRHGERAIYRDSQVVWLFALSSPAKEAWFIALRSCVVRLEAERRGTEEDLRSLDRMRVEADDFSKFTQSVRKYREESMRRDASAKGTHGFGAGIAGATINALGSRLFYDMFRDERWQREQTGKLIDKLNNAPGTPKFVGAFEITHIDFGSTVPHVISARVPNFSSSSAPWDGAEMPGRGSSHALELDIEYVGRATMTVQTRVDLSKYAQDMESEANRSTSEGALDDFNRSLSSLKKAAAREAAKMVASLSDTLRATPLRFTLTLKKCQGVVRLWIPPPPGDRLWWGLMKEPDVDLEIIPEVGDTAISSEGVASRVSQFLRNLFVEEMHNQLLIPHCVAETWKELRPFVDITELTVAEASTAGEKRETTTAATAIEEETLPDVPATSVESESVPTSPIASTSPTFSSSLDSSLDPFARSNALRTSFEAIPTSPPKSPSMERPQTTSTSLPSSPTERTIVGFGAGFTIPRTEPKPRPSADRAAGSFFAQAAARAKQFERSVTNDFKEFSNALKDAGVVGGIAHVSKNIERMAASSTNRSERESDDENDPARA